MLVSALVMTKADPGCLVVSDTTRRMIFRKPFIYDTFDWQEYISFLIPDSETDVMVQTFVCEQIFAELDSFSE